jgi:hypothetical protein
MYFFAGDFPATIFDAGVFSPCDFCISFGATGFALAVLTGLDPFGGPAFLLDDFATVTLLNPHLPYSKTKEQQV